MFEVKVSLGVLAIIIAFGAFIPYYRDIYLKKTKPHAFSWLVWSVLMTITFFAQINNKGGAGAWVTGFTAVICISIFILALFRGEKEITLTDKLSLGGALLAILAWIVTKEPLTAIILVVIVEVFAFYPTYRKSFHKPHEETATMYFLDTIKYVVSILALENYTFVTYLYPAAIIVMDSGFVALVLIRRKQLRKARKKK